jgi:hypothetical protein
MCGKLKENEEEMERDLARYKEFSQLMKDN